MLINRLSLYQYLIFIFQAFPNQLVALRDK